jgi:hypothetical protein
MKRYGFLKKQMKENGSAAGKSEEKRCQMSILCWQGLVIFSLRKEKEYPGLLLKRYGTLQ